MSKRIGIDCRMYSSKFTGIGRYVFELVQNLQNLDNQNEYYLFFNDPIYEQAKLVAPNFYKVRTNAPHYSFKEQTKFFRQLLKHRLDLMHFTHFNAPILYRKPSIVTIHDLTLHFFPGKKMTSKLYRLAYRQTIKSITKKSKKIIAVSKNTSKDLQDLLKIPDHKIEVLYEGVNSEFKPISDQDRLQATVQKHGINKPFLLYTGNWRNHKNLIGLIKAFKQLVKNHQIQLVVTGRKDPLYAPEIIQEAGPHTKNGDIVFAGLVPENELIDLINTATIYTYPSFYEGFGLPPLEAMKCHTPVVASNTSCIPESCGDAAIYFDPYDTNDMVEKISTLLLNPQLQQQMIEKGRRHVQQFSWEKMAREVINLYNNVS